MNPASRAESSRSARSDIQHLIKHNCVSQLQFFLFQYIDYKKVLIDERSQSIFGGENFLATSYCVTTVVFRFFYSGLAIKPKCSW